MSKKSPLPQTRRHVMIYDEDYDFIVAEFGPESKNKVGVSVAIRTILHAKVQDLKMKANSAFDKIRQDLKEEQGQ